MGEPGGGSSFKTERVEPHHAGAIGRSSSVRPLLEPAPSAAVAVAVGGGGGPPTSNLAAAIVAMQHEEEVLMSSQLEKVVVMVPTSRELPPSPAEVVEDGEWKGKGPSGGSVGRLFVTKNSCVEMSLAQEVVVSSEEEEKEKKKKDKKKEKKKKKKSSSWWPDPEKRWPIQGFY